MKLLPVRLSRSLLTGDTAETYVTFKCVRVHGPAAALLMSKVSESISEQVELLAWKKQEFIGEQ